MNTDYCAECHLTVAPHDPEQKVYRGKVYHGKCLKQVQAKQSVGPVQMQIIWSGKEPLGEHVN